MSWLIKDIGTELRKQFLYCETMSWYQYLQHSYPIVICFIHFLIYKPPFLLSSIYKLISYNKLLKYVHILRELWAKLVTAREGRETNKKTGKQLEWILRYYSFWCQYPHQPLCHTQYAFYSLPIETLLSHQLLLLLLFSC